MIGWLKIELLVCILGVFFKCLSLIITSVNCIFCNNKEDAYIHHKDLIKCH